MSELKAKFRWRCRRGMRELDAVLLGYLDTRFDELDPQEMAAFEAVLALSDPELHAYLLGRAAPQDSDLERIIADIGRSFCPAS